MTRPLARLHDRWLMVRDDLLSGVLLPDGERAQTALGRTVITAVDRRVGCGWINPMHSAAGAVRLMLGIDEPVSSDYTIVLSERATEPQAARLAKHVHAWLAELAEQSAAILRQPAEREAMYQLAARAYWGVMRRDGDAPLVIYLPPALDQSALALCTAYREWLSAVAWWAASALLGVPHWRPTVLLPRVVRAVEALAREVPRR
ncbi:MAG: hypothetical protein KatS3mg060_1141 [Dehalococcoidia bacterium]|nr:MAG: hypothetical protein KatS3mg060_1141 [Dehalococcoidia bacterium]